jgi:hypothetical protein
MSEPVYDFPDIAALLVMMLRNLSAEGLPHGSFDEQLQKSMGLLPKNPVFTDSLQVVSFLHAKRPDLFANLHNAVRALLEELQQTQTNEGLRWSVCAFISQDQIKRIGRL